MLKLYLHIGMPKTGTTYIQNFLRLNNEILKKEGYIFPDFGVRFDKIGNNRNGHFLLSVIRDENRKRLLEKEQEIENECFEKLFSLYDEYENVILSEESLWNSAERKRGNDFWKNLKDKLKTHGVTLKVIVYLRRQDLFVQSFWSQQVKENNVSNTFQEFLKSPRFKRIKLDYHKRIEQIAEAIGKENMLVRVYEKDQYIAPQKTIIADFLNTVELKYTEEYTELDRLPNRSLSGIYLETMRELNKLDIFNERKNFTQWLLKTVVENNDDVKSIFSNEFMSGKETIAFLKKYEKENEAVAKDYLSRESGELFFEKPEISNDEKSEYKFSDYICVLAQMLDVQNDKICEQTEMIKELKAENKQLQSTINWVTTSFPKKVIRKLKRIIKGIFKREKKSEE